jgi:hypothetical protein
MPLKQSLYDVTKHSQDNILNTGFDYQGQLFSRTMSSFLFLEAKRANILASLEAIYYEMIQRVKTIKTFYDYAKEKDYRKFN